MAHVRQWIIVSAALLLPARSYRRSINGALADHAMMINAKTASVAKDKDSSTSRDIDCAAAVREGNDMSKTMLSLSERVKLNCQDEWTPCPDLDRLKSMQEPMVETMKLVYFGCEGDEAAKMWQESQVPTLALVETMKAKPDLNGPGLVASAESDPQLREDVEMAQEGGAQSEEDTTEQVRWLADKLENPSSAVLPPEFVTACGKRDPIPGVKGDSHFQHDTYQWDVLDVEDVHSAMAFVSASSFRIRPEDGLTAGIQSCTFGAGLQLGRDSGRQGGGQTSRGSLIAFQVGSSSSVRFESKHVRSKESMKAMLSSIGERDTIQAITCPAHGKLLGAVPLGSGVVANVSKTLLGPLVSRQYDETGAGKPCAEPEVSAYEVMPAPSVGFLKAAEGELGVCAPMEDTYYYLHRLSCAVQAVAMHLDPPIPGSKRNTSNKIEGIHAYGLVETNATWHPLITGVGGVLGLVFKGPAYGIMLTCAVIDHLVAGFAAVVGWAVNALATVIALPAYPFLGMKRGGPGFQKFIAGVLMAPLCVVTFALKCVTASFMIGAEIMNGIGNALAFSPSGRPLGHANTRDMFGARSGTCGR